MKASCASGSACRWRGRGRRGAKPRRRIQLQARRTSQPLAKPLGGVAYVPKPIPGMGLAQGLIEGLLEFGGQEGGLAFVLVPEVLHGQALVVAVDQRTNPAFAIAEVAGDLGDGLTFGQQPEGLPAGAFNGV